VKAKEEEKTNDKAKDKEDVKGRKRKRVTVSQMMTGKSTNYCYILDAETRPRKYYSRNNRTSWGAETVLHCLPVAIIERSNFAPSSPRRRADDPLSVESKSNCTNHI
jgi:hypothetical protein